MKKRIEKLGSKIQSNLPNFNLIIPYFHSPKILLRINIKSELSLLSGFYEKKVIRFFKKNIHKNSVVFDIGSNIGIYTLLPLLKKGVKVYSFEPSPYNVLRLKNNITLNKFNNRVKVEQVAVSDTNDIIALYISKSQRRNTIVKKNLDPIDTIQVKCITLDDYCKNNEVSPDFIKIDVEGVADKVLDGATSIIQSMRTKWLLELHNEKEKISFAEKFDVKHYKVLTIDSGHKLAIPKSLVKN